MRRSSGIWLITALLAAGAAAQTPDPQEASPPLVEVDTGGDAADAAPDWQSELDLIADLLIDGKPQEAKEKAERLLENDSLPEDVASRARTLRDKADARLAATSPAASKPKPKIEIPPKSGNGDKAEKPAEAEKELSFRVRVAAIGGGFTRGASGLLRISEQGVSFVPQGKTGEGWTIRWPELAEARNDTGLWDAPYPLVLIERSGRKRYVARLDQEGSYLPGAPLLSAIEKGRRKQKEPAAGKPKPAEPKEGG